MLIQDCQLLFLNFEAFSPWLAIMSGWLASLLAEEEVCVCVWWGVKTVKTLDSPCLSFIHSVDFLLDCFFAVIFL